MKVLVLSVSTGGGHYSTSLAIAKYINESGNEAKVVDVYEYISPIISDSISKGYLLSTKYAKTMYGQIYKRMEKSDASEKRMYLSKAANTVLSIPFAKCVEEYKPDVIVSTHVMACEMTDALRNYGRLDDNVITIGIVTDFTVHPLWEDTYVDYYVSASELLNNQFIKKKIDLDKVKPFGIPIDEKYAKKIPQSEARKELGIEDKQTVLVMSGSMGYGNVIKHIKELDKLDIDFQMIIVCGRNKSLRKRLDGLKTEKEKYVYGFAKNVDVLMDASDCIITKPGGLTVSESLAKGLPMILMNPIPGQEDRNLEFLLNNGLAQYITDTYPVDEAVYQLFNNKWKQENLREGIKYIGKPNAVKDLCNFILEL